MLFSITVIGVSCYSQTTESDQMLKNSVTITSFDYGDKGLVGSSYINDAFLPAKLSDNNETYFLRYNAYKDEMEGKKNNNFYRLIKKLDYTISFKAIDKTYKVLNYEDDNKNILGFFVVLFNGDKISLLAKERIKFFEEVKAKTGYDKYQPPTLKQLKDKLYISYNNKEASELPDRKNDILNLFSSKAVEVEKYAKKNKLKLKSTDDLIQLFKYYNALN